MNSNPKESSKAQRATAAAIFFSSLLLSLFFFFRKSFLPGYYTDNRYYERLSTYPYRWIAIVILAAAIVLCLLILTARVHLSLASSIRQRAQASIKQKREKRQTAMSSPQSTQLMERGATTFVDKKGENMEKITANKVAQFVARLSGILLILGVIGSIIIALSPTETCEEFSFGGEYCEKDWTTSITTGLVGLLVNSLVMLTILMVSLYIQERTPTTDK